MNYKYRVIIYNLQTASATDSFFNDLSEAYKACIPDKTTFICSLMLHGLEKKIQKGETLIRITCYRDVVYWIQDISDKTLPLVFPDLSIASICHHS
jgi:hypothetical protein